MLSKQSIRGKVQIYIEQELATKQDVINLSQEWSENQETIFKKMLKQGGKFKIKGVNFNVVPEDRIVTSRGEKDGGVQKIPRIDERF